MIDHWERNEIDVDPEAQAYAFLAAEPSYGNAFSVNEHQSFFRQQTPQVWYDAAITTIDHVLVNSRSHLLRQIGEEVRGVADPQSLDVARAICVNWIGPGFFRGWNI